MVLDTAIKDTDVKLNAFNDSILADAEEEARKITSELHQKQNELISKAEAEISADTQRRTKIRIAEIEARESRRVAARMTDNKRALLQCREDCAAEAFGMVRAKIEAFTASEEYLPQLKSLLSQAVSVLGYGYSATVYLRPEDMRFSDALMSSVSGVSLAFCEGNFSLGGLSMVCQSKGRRIDMTFDSAMTDMLGHFSELSGMNISD